MLFLLFILVFMQCLKFYSVVIFFGAFPCSKNA